MAKTERNEALAALAQLLREADGEKPATTRGMRPPSAADFRRAERYLTGLGIDSNEFAALLEGDADEGETHLPLVEGLLDRLVESSTADRSRVEVYGEAAEDPDLDQRVREIVRNEVERLKKTGGPVQDATERRNKKPR